VTTASLMQPAADAVLTQQRAEVYSWDPHDATLQPPPPAHVFTTATQILSSSKRLYFL